MNRSVNPSFFPYIFLGFFALTLSSCSVYKQHFDCPPPSGIPCASVTEIESMIVETEKGPDFLLIPEVAEDKRCFWCNQKKIDASSSFKANRKVWICQKLIDGGCVLKGYYMQQSECILEPEDFFSCIEREEGKKD